MYWIKAFQRRLCIPIYLWQALRLLQTSLALLGNTQEYTVSNLCLFLSLSLAAVARGQLIILALPIPHLQQHTGHCAAAPANDEDEMHDQRLNRASTTRTQLQNTTSRK